MSDLLAVIQESIHVLQQRNITASPLKQHRIEMAVDADDIGGGFDLSASAILKHLARR